MDYEAFCVAMLFTFAHAGFYPRYLDFDAFNS